MPLALNHASDQRPGNCAPSKTRPSKSSGDKHVLHAWDTTDMRQAIGRIVELGRPVMFKATNGEMVADVLFEFGKALALIDWLSTLMIAAANDQQMRIMRRCQANVMIRLGVVPIERVGNLLLDAGCHHIRLIGKHTAFEFRNSEIRRMGRDDYTIRPNLSAIGVQGQRRTSAWRLGGGVFKNAATMFM